MTDKPPDEFPATALIDTHVKLLDVADVGDDLIEALDDLVGMAGGCDEPAFVGDAGRTRHLVWRGYLTGGLMTVWLRLGGALRDAEVSAFVGDPRLEVFVPAHGEVAVFGVLRQAVVLSWEEWDERVRAAGSVEDLVAGFVHDAIGKTPPFTPREHRSSSLDDDEDDDAVAFPDAERIHEKALYAPRPEMIEQLAPGEIDWEILDESQADLTICCDPDGNVQRESVVCYLMRWRTEFAAPGTPLADESWQDSFQWTVGQWRWEGEEEDTEQDNWILRGKQPINVMKALEQMPEPLRPWVLDATRRAISDLEELAEEQEELGVALEMLRAQLAAVETAK
jgi:hypothetical protein